MLYVFNPTLKIQQYLSFTVEPVADPVYPLLFL